METVSIPTAFDCEQIARAIMGEEAYRLKFVDNRIVTGKRGQYNEASFDFYIDGAYPPDCTMRFGDEAAPENYTEEWRGQMLVQDEAREVVLYRAPAR
jgi:hypothetical protein